jgi:hypothetical protein
MRSIFEPGWVITIDESMLRWTNKLTIPNAVFLPGKPTPLGQEFKDIACSSSKVVFVIEMVETETKHKRFEDYRTGKTAALILRLTENLFSPKPRLLIADSAFPSIRVARALRQHNIRFISCVKKRRYWPTGIPGEAITSAVSALELGAVKYLESDRKDLFIACCKDTLPIVLLATAGDSSVVDDDIQTRYVKDEKFEFKRSLVYSLYYKHRHSVDDNNNLRSHTAPIDAGFGTHNWILRTFSFIVALAEANAFAMYKYDCELSNTPKNEILSHKAFRASIIQSMLPFKHEQPLQASPCGIGRLSKTKEFNPVLGRFEDRAEPLTYSPQRICADCKRQKQSLFCTCSLNTVRCEMCLVEHIRKVAREE